MASIRSRAAATSTDTTSQGEGRKPAQHQQLQGPWWLHRSGAYPHRGRPGRGGSARPGRSTCWPTPAGRSGQGGWVRWVAGWVAGGCPRAHWCRVWSKAAGSSRRPKPAPPHPCWCTIAGLAACKPAIAGVACLADGLPSCRPAGTALRPLGGRGDQAGLCRRSGHLLCKSGRRHKVGCRGKDLRSVAVRRHFPELAEAHMPSKCGSSELSSTAGRHASMYCSLPRS